MATIAEKTLDANGNVAVRITARSDSNLSEHTVDGNGAPALRVATTNIKNLNEHTVDENGAPALRVICEDGSVGGGEPVAKTKYGASVDTFLGDVDGNGVLQAPTAETALDFSGVKEILASGLQYVFLNAKIKGINATDLTTVNSSSFAYTFKNATMLADAVFGLETITSESAFTNAFYGAKWQNNSKPRFPNLKTVKANRAFESVFSYGSPFTATWDDMFPVLEEIQGDICFYTFAPITSVTATALKKIVGSSAYYNATFTGLSAKEYFLPNVTDILKYVFPNSGTIKVHFAAANQAAIEACEGYNYKFGLSSSSEILFDL